MSTVPSQPPPPAPYWSLLICSHESGNLANVYLNGRSLGCLRKGVWEPQTLAPNDRAVMLRDVADLRAAPSGGWLGESPYRHTTLSRATLPIHEETIHQSP